MLRTLRDSPDSETLIKRLGRFVSRRGRTQAPAGFLVTWESELRAIAADASAWSIETGGDLFGRWHDVPTVLLATKPGPNAQRDHAHFRLDVDYLRHLSEVMASDWALRYFGDWHSHHRLGLSAPSGGDRRRIASIGTRNQFGSMAEIIVTLDDPPGRIDRPHPSLGWYHLAGEAAPSPLRVKILPGLSPIRQALISRKALPEQELHAWEKATLQRIRIAGEDTAPTLEAAFDIDSMTRERVLAQLVDALANESGAPIEQHTTGFGSILVARLQEPQYLAFALGSAWPMPVLEVHRMNRADGSTEPVNTLRASQLRTSRGFWRFFAPTMCPRRELEMWTYEQRQRLLVENQILIGEGFDQFQVYRDPTYDSYSASGYATANSGRRMIVHSHSDRISISAAPRVRHGTESVADV